MKHAVKTNPYRLNQAVTFFEMLNVARKEFGEDFWFLTLDADQFYDDSYISNFKEIINKIDSNINLLTATELTFNESKDKYTDKYEKRTWNNMPHRHEVSTVILPTRDIKICSLFSCRSYYSLGRVYNLGRYFHYKFRINKGRAEDSYKLGDRVAPNETRTTDSLLFKEKHPRATKF